MARVPAIPSYRLHKPSGQARVIVGGKQIYLGPFGSPESQRRYAQLLAERFSPWPRRFDRPCGRGDARRGS